MVSSELKEQWMQAACLIDLAEQGSRPVHARDHMVRLQIDKLFQLQLTAFESVTDYRFWNDAELRDTIFRAINAQKGQIKGLMPAINALSAIHHSYEVAYPNKTFGYSS